MWQLNQWIALSWAQHPNSALCPSVPIYHFMCNHTCGQFPPPTASKGIIKHFYCAEGNSVYFNLKKKKVNKSVILENKK